MNWYKLAAYSYIEDVQNQLLRAIPILDKCNQKECRDSRKEVATTLRLLEKYRVNPKSLSWAEINNLFSRARAATYKTQKVIERAKLDQKLLPGLQETINRGQAGWYLWEKQPGGIYNQISLVPSNKPGEPPKVLLKGLDFGDTKIAQQLKQQMGDWVQFEKKLLPPEKGSGFSAIEYNVYVRGTKEAWDKFRELSASWLEDDSLLRKIRFSLSSESGSIGQTIQPQKAGVQEKLFKAIPLNIPNMVGIKTKPLGKETLRPGIRLQFAIEDPTLSMIRDYSVDKGRTGIRFNPAEGYIDIFETGDVDNITSAGQWGAIKKKLQSVGYPNTAELEPIIISLTGMRTVQAYEEIAEEKKSVPLGIGATATAINKNLNIVNGQLQPVIGNRFSISKDQPVTEEQFNHLLIQQYPKAFTRPQLVKAQQKGMYHIATRDASILADDQGSGKTIQAVVAAEVTRNQGQKILVVSPNILVAENWIGLDVSGQQIAKAPGQFLGHDVSTIRVCKNSEEIINASKDPNVIWVVVPESVLSLPGQQFPRTIKELSKKGIFSSVIIDEIQHYKLPNSKKARKKANIRLTNLSRAISAYHIKHRIGLTGTPSDDNPMNIYAQMYLLRHPILFDTSKPGDWTEALNDKGFANQFLGGATLSEPLKMSRDLSLAEEEDDEITQPQLLLERENERHSIWLEKAKSVLEWFRNLDDRRKIQILDLFSSVFLRRNKKDIDPNIPPKTRNVIMLPVPDDLEMPKSNIGWHISLLKKSAEKKANYTAQKAIEYLKDPQQKIFVVTGNPSVADAIANQINTIYGDGCAASVHQKTTEKMRQQIKETFKSKIGKSLSGPVPLRVVCYTSKLGAVGLNFEIATKCIVNDMDWNPSNNLQAEDRIYRITSDKPVNIDYMMFDNSYDKEMYERVKQKETINTGVSDLIRQAGMAKDDNEKLKIANSFVKMLLENILMDVPLTNEEEKWFAQQLETISF